MNAVDGVGNTPVHTACHRGSLKSVITLLKYGSSNIHAKNKAGLRYTLLLEKVI